MKIIFLFLVYKNVDFVSHTCSQLSGDDVYFYLHVDKKSQEQWDKLRGIKNLFFLKERFDSKWGGPELVYATIGGLKEICRTHDDGWIILMSESDYPVKTIEYIKDYLSLRPKDYIKSSPLPCDNPLGYPGNYWIEGGMRRVNSYALRLGPQKIATIEPRTFNWGNMRQFGKVLLFNPSKLGAARRLLFSQKRTLPAGIRYYCGGDQWFILRISTGRKILDFIRDNPQVLDDAKYIECVDEVFFQTIVAHVVPKEETVCSTLRFINWPIGQSDSPGYLEMNNLEMLDRQIDDKDVLFVRKVKDEEVANYIDERLCNGI